MDLIIPSAKRSMFYQRSGPLSFEAQRAKKCPLSLRMENEPFMHQGVNPFR